jgi:hypothetical protein
MKTPAILGSTLAFAASLLGAGAVQATEQPRYDVVEKVGSFEVRRYGPRLAAEVTVSGSAESARNAGFRKLAAYIFGGNTTRASIAMTAPVVQSARGQSESIAMTAPVVQSGDSAGGWRVQFIMPSRYTRETLPTPNDRDVRIVALPAQDYAVLRFSGDRSGPAVDRRIAELKRTAAARGWRATGATVSWFYDPPWTPPFLRRNEVAVPVARNR